MNQIARKNNPKGKNTTVIARINQMMLKIIPIKATVFFGCFADVWISSVICKKIINKNLYW